MLNRLLGNVTTTQDNPEKINKPKEKKVTSGKVGRGNKSDVVIKIEE